MGSPFSRSVAFDDLGKVDREGETQTTVVQVTGMSPTPYLTSSTDNRTDLRARCPFLIKMDRRSLGGTGGASSGKTNTSPSAFCGGNNVGSSMSRTFSSLPNSVNTSSLL
jgi:hypothetical protein